MNNDVKHPAKRNWLNVIKKNIREKKPYVFSEVSAEIKLDQNESPYDIPQALKQEIVKKVCKRSWNRYPSITGEPLRFALSKYLDVPVNHIAVGVGSDELLGAAASIVLSKDKTALFVEPTFQIYEQCAVTYEANRITLRLNPDFSYPVEKLLGFVKSRCVGMSIIASPNSPTGNSIDVCALEEIIKATSGLVVVDEAYFEFCNVTALPLQKKYKNLIITRTFSKAFSLAGLRIGYLIADPYIIKCIYKVKMPFSLNVFSEIAAITLLENPGVINRNVEKILKNKNILCAQLQKMPNIKVFPSEANFFIINVSRNGREVANEFEKYGIAVRDVSHYPMLDNFIRINVGNHEENRKVIEVMHKIMGN